ncbi:MAG: riboflavin synthase subunit alpha [Myxococcales bacterium]|nr:riboflavin synthase subunit alpha [Polyangiaceae bacterium]MDW8251350.1 riboflavin synthase subunit alpha [Myxococcales bacterium]
MFTGIVKGLGEVTEVQLSPGLLSLRVILPAGLGEGLQRGASVAIDGVCLTAVEIDGDLVRFDAMQETLTKTTLGSLRVGSRVNVERSFCYGDEVGGHLVSGHVTGTCPIITVEETPTNRVLTFQVDPSWMRYLLPKGFVALDGCSLTVSDTNRENATFRVWFIPETLRLTTFGFKKEGDLVNLEIDSRTQAIVDTVERYLESRLSEVKG